MKYGSSSLCCKILPLYEKYVNYFNEIIIELMKNKKIIPVIGVSPETFYTRSLDERPEGFMNRVKEDIIKYYS